eukprot:72023_1
MSAPAPIPQASNDTNTNTNTQIVAPPLRTSVKKRYDEEQEKKMKKLKLYIENLTKISTVTIIEGYLRDIQESRVYDEWTLFQNIPAGVIHLCYKFSTQFKNYFILLSCKHHEVGSKPQIQILGINDIEPTSKAISKKIKNLIPNPKYHEMGLWHDHVYSKYIDKTLLYIPHLTISSQITRTLNINDTHIRSGIFRTYSQRQTGRQCIEMFYFPSPYYYDYKLDIENNKKLQYYQYDLPRTIHSTTETHSAIHIPFTNQMINFSRNRNDNIISVFDIYNMKWLTNKNNNNFIQLSDDATKSRHSLCLCENKLFLIGGTRDSAKSSLVAMSNIEILDCVEINNLFHDNDVQSGKKKRKKNKCRVKSIKGKNMNVARAFAGCDVIRAKNNMIVVGGGASQSFWDTSRIAFSADKASNSIELFDHYKDVWMSMPGKTKYPHQKAVLWCSGNLVFMTGGYYCAKGVKDIGNIECIDIREKTNTWQVIDDRNVQKLFNMFNRRDADALKMQGLFI